MKLEEFSMKLLMLFKLKCLLLPLQLVLLNLKSLNPKKFYGKDSLNTNTCKITKMYTTTKSLLEPYKKLIMKETSFYMKNPFKIIPLLSLLDTIFLDTLRFPSMSTPSMELLIPSKVENSLQLLIEK